MVVLYVVVLLLVCGSWAGYLVELFSMVFVVVSICLFFFFFIISDVKIFLLLSNFLLYPSLWLVDYALKILGQRESLLESFVLALAFLL